MSIKTKTYIPSWLWTELEIFIAYPESKHKEIRFVMEKEGFDLSMLEKERFYLSMLAETDDKIFTRFQERDMLTCVLMVVLDFEGNKETVIAEYLYKTSPDTIRLIRGLGPDVVYNATDILIIRDPYTKRRIVIDDTYPLWTGNERHSKEKLQLLDIMDKAIKLFNIL